MGILYITEYQEISNMPVSRHGQMPQEPALATQTVSYTTHAESSAFNTKTRFVRLHTDSICSFVFGTAPVAVTTDSRMAAGQTEYHAVPVNQTFKVSAVANT